MMTATEGETGTESQAHVTRPHQGIGIILATFSLLFLLAAITARRAQAQAYIVLHSFTGAPGDGMWPYDGLLLDADGNLYGTTIIGGASNFGTVFKLDASGVETVLHSFTDTDGDGLNPVADLVTDTEGNLYGTTVLGGTSGYGTVFKLGTNGVETVLHSFTGLDGDGMFPYAGLLLGTDGNFYGTTGYGGDVSLNEGSGWGVVFKLNASGSETIHAYTDGPDDGAEPIAGLIMDSSGILYGTTSLGGSSGSCFGGCGTVFKLDTSGNNFSVLHRFSRTDGALSQGGLIMDSAGNLYGTTFQGGSSTNCGWVFEGEEPAGCGTVFKLDTSGNLTILHDFSGSDGQNPYGELIMDPEGNLYGTTARGGSSSNCGTQGCGTVFKLDTSGGNFSVLHSFSGAPNDGNSPPAGLTVDSAGILYGTTTIGGSSSNCGTQGCGTVFALASTPRAGAQLIINLVNALHSQGVLNEGQAHSRVKVLQQTIKLIEKGKVTGAIGTLEGFINGLNGLYNSGKLNQEQYMALISAANSVVEQLQAG